MAGQLIAQSILRGDERWRLFSPFELVWAGGATGRVAGQVVALWVRGSSAAAGALARYRERARAKERIREARLAEANRQAGTRPARPRPPPRAPRPERPPAPVTAEPERDEGRRLPSRSQESEKVSARTGVTSAARRRISRRRHYFAPNATETIMIDRRILLASVAGLVGIAGLRWLRAAPAQATEKFEIEKTDAEWRAQLTPEQYQILRQQGTEPPFTSPLLEEHRKGIFACAGCDLPLFSSETKFESGTGWPSFYQPLENAVGKHQDRMLGMLRTEIHCRRCGGHLGHVFDDGPKPTGLRYCMDGLALQFHPAAASAT